MTFQLDRGLFQFEFTDRHAILGVRVNAAPQNIRERYQIIARSLHPDSGEWKTDADRQLAVQIFSRLVTHAYGQLSKSSQLQEQTIMLELLGKRLVEEGNRVKIVDPLAQQLYQSGTDFELVYDRLLTQLVTAQYADLANSVQVINQISELNMVYLLRRQLQSVGSTPPSALNGNIAAPGATKQSITADANRVSPVEGALRRAEERMSKQNWVQAVPELREVISVEPNNVRAHTLLGLVYLRQQQLTMAKISLDKALQLAPRDPQVLQAKQELDRGANPTAKSAQSKTASKKHSGGIFGLFGKK